MSEYIFVTNTFEYSNIFVTLCNISLILIEIISVLLWRKSKTCDRNCPGGNFLSSFQSRQADICSNQHSQHQYKCLCGMHVLFHAVFFPDDISQKNWGGVLSSSYLLNAELECWGQNNPTNSHILKYKQIFGLASYRYEYK